MTPAYLKDVEQQLKVIVIPSDLSCVRKPEEAILGEIENQGFSEDSIFAIKLTLEEAMTNAIKHGNKCDESKQVTVRYFVDAEQAVICIRDEGKGFEPEAVPDPTTPEHLSLPNGRGILLMRAYIGAVDYLENGTEIVLEEVERIMAEPTDQSSSASAAALNIEHQERGREVVVVVSGMAAAEVAGQLSRALQEAASKGPQLLAIDLSGLNFISSTGLGGLVAAHVACQNHGAKMCLINPRPFLREILQVTKLEDLLVVCDDLAEARQRSNLPAEPS